MIETVAAALVLVKEIGMRIATATIAITAGTILFAPPSVLSALGLTDFMLDNRGFLGLLFLLSLGTLTVLFLQSLSSLISSERAEHLRERSTEQRRVEVLMDLTPSEKAYLLPYIRDQEGTQYFSLTDGVAGGLVAKGILFRASNLGSMKTGFAYNLQPWARRQLAKNPKLLRGAGAPPPRPLDRLLGDSWGR